MKLEAYETIIIIISVASATMITRFLPFIIFSKKQNKTINYLANALPPAMMGLLVIYCLKDIEIFNFASSFKEIIAIIFIIILHKWKNNYLLSIIGGTALYMLLINVI